MNKSSLKRLTKEVELYFPIKEHIFEERGKAKPTRKVTIVDPTPSRTKLLMECYANVLNTQTFKLIGVAKRGFIKLKKRLDEVNRKKHSDKKLFYDYFRLLNQYGMNTDFSPSFYWWYSDAAWTTYLAILGNQFPSGYF